MTHAHLCVASGPRHMDIQSVLHYKPLNWVMRGASFVVYVVFAMIFLTDFINDNKCHVKHTYRSELASSILSNPMYTSNQVWRNPPRTKIETEMMGLSSDQQRHGDIGVFPTIMRDTNQDAAFLPIVHVPHGDIKDRYDNTTDEYKGITELRNIFLSNGTTPGSVMTEVMVDVSKKMLSVDDTFVGVKSNGGLLPNFARCVNITTKKTEDASKYYSELKKFVDHSFYRGSCALTGLQQKVDIQVNPKTSLAPFSSISLFFVPHVIFWIAASFQLSYLFYGDEEKESYQTLAVSAAIVWNAVGIFIAMAIGAMAGMHVPANNIWTAVLLYVATIVVQWNWNAVTMTTKLSKLRNSATKRLKKVTIFRRNKKNEQEQSLLGNTRATKGRVGAEPMPRSIGANFRDFARSYDTEGGESVYDQYEQLSTVLTFESMEHTLTVPLIIVYIVAAYSAQVIPTATLQMLFVMVLVVRVLCAAIFRLQQVRITDPGIDRQIFECISGMYFMVLVLAVTYTYISMDFYARTGGAIVGIITLEWLYIIFVGLVVFYEFVYSFTQEYILQWALVPAFFDMLLKVIALAYMWEAAKGSNRPNHACSMWAHLQGDTHIELLEEISKKIADLALTTK